MTTYCIIDIDTTIANNDHRAALLKRKCVDCGTEVGSEHRAVCPACGCEKSHAPQSSWDEFLRHDLMINDIPQPHALEVINAMRSRGYKIVFLTGRNEKHRYVTQQWLMDNMDWQHKTEPVLMRPDEQKDVPASQMKEDMFLKFVQDFQNNQFLFFEDDRHVLGIWQKYGMVFLCPEVWPFMNPEVRKEGEQSWSR